VGGQPESSASAIVEVAQRTTFEARGTRSAWARRASNATLVRVRSPSALSLAALALMHVAGCETEARDVARDAPDEDAGLDAEPAADALEVATNDASLDAGPDASSAPAPWFVDVTDAWGIAYVRDGAEGYETITDRIGGGVCPIDLDGEAPLDLVFPMRRTDSSHTRLFVGRGGSEIVYSDETGARGLEHAGDVHACLAFDADADGDEDLALAGRGTVQLFENEGGQLSEITARLGLSLDPRDVYAGMAAGDVDHDGDVDLFVAGFLRFDVSRFAPGARCGVIPCRSSLYEFEGIRDLVMLRDDDGSYRDATDAIAPDLLRDEMTLVPAIRRMTGTGPVDLFVGNDLGARYRDRVLRWSDATGAYVDVGIELGLATNARGYGIDTMGWSQGDLDGDGTLDFVTSSWPGDTTAAHFCGTLTDGDFCEERGRAVGLSTGVGSFRWGVGVGDLDLDGDLDVLEATGHLYAQDDLGRTADELQPPNLYENVDGALERRVYPAGDALAARATLRGLSLVDLDDDGRLDVVMAPSRGEPRILRNVHAREGHWLRVALHGQAAGARLVISWTGGRVIRAHPVGEGFMGNFDPRVHVGLPAYVTRVELDVHWPSGEISRRTDVAVDTELSVASP